MRQGRPCSPRRWWLAVALAIAAIAVRPSTAHAQCVWLFPTSCMTVAYTPLTSTPTATDFANGLAVLGSFTVSILQCNRAPCELTVGAQGQPIGGLRLRVGGAAPVSLADCPIDLTGVVSPASAQAPVIAQTNGAVSLTVWVCRPLSWNPSVTPLGTTSTEVRFRLRQS